MERKTARKKAEPRAQWQIDDGERLRRLFEKHSEIAKISQAEFGLQFEIGSQAVVWQLLHPESPKGRPLNVTQAARFAAGLGCRVSEFSPTLQKEIDRIARHASSPVAPLTADEESMLQNYRRLPDHERYAFFEELRRRASFAVIMEKPSGPQHLQ